MYKIVYLQELKDQRKRDCIWKESETKELIQFTGTTKTNKQLFNFHFKPRIESSARTAVLPEIFVVFLNSYIQIPRQYFKQTIWFHRHTKNNGNEQHEATILGTSINKGTLKCLIISLNDSERKRTGRTKNTNFIHNSKYKLHCTQKSQGKHVHSPLLQLILSIILLLL